MSTARTTLPRTTAWAASLVAALGLGSLAVTSPTLGVGAFTGVVVGLSVRGLGRSPWWTALAVATLPLGVGGVLVALVLSGGTGAVALTATGTAVGISGVGLIAGPLEPGQPRLLLGSAAASLVTLAPGAVVSAQVESAGGPLRAFAEFVSLTGGGTAGLVVWVLVTGAGAVLATVILPPAVRANIWGQPVEFADGPQLPVTVVVVTLAVALVVWLGSAVPVAGSAVESLVASRVAHNLAAGVTLLLGCVTVLGLFAGGVWQYRVDTPVMALGTGALVGAMAVVVVSALVTTETGRSPTAVYRLVATGLTGVVVIAGWAADGFTFGGLVPDLSLGPATPRRDTRWEPRDRYPDRFQLGPSLEPLSPRRFRAGRLVPAGLIGGAVLVALGLEPTPSLEQAGVLVAIASGLFVHTLVTRGQAAARDVGPGNVSRLSQFVWVGWTAGLGLFGLVVATGGLLLAGTFPVPLSVPAAAGVALALVALVAGLGLLSRSRSG